MFDDRINQLTQMYVDTVEVYLRKTPNDRWLSSELIRMDMDRGWYIPAFERVQRCKGEEWWCTGLAAYVMNMAGVRARADSAWTRALAVMPERERCAWLDPTWVSDDKPFRKAYQSASCAEQIRMAERAWWLADPLYSVDGNERRSEHLSRLMDLVVAEGGLRRSRMTPAMVRTFKPPPAGQSVLGALDPDFQLKNAPWRLLWRFGYTEVFVRAGPPHHFARTWDNRSVAQYPHPRVSFVPRGHAFGNHLEVTSDDWIIYDRDAFEFMNGWLAPMRGVDYQVAWFRRGDSARVVAASDIRADSLLAAIALTPTLILQRDYDAEVTRVTGTGSGVSRFGVTAVPESTLLSLELVASNGTSGRARMGSGPPPMPRQRVTTSDILLVESRDEPPSSLEDAETRTVGVSRFAADSTITLFWEMYGLAAGEKPRIEVTATRDRGSLLGGLLRAVTARQGSASLAVIWEEPAVQGNAIEARSIAIGLNSLEEGLYTLSLAVDVPGQQRVVTRRRLQVRRSR
jgi:hypothetical protein